MQFKKRNVIVNSNRGEAFQLRWWDHGSSTLMDEFNALIKCLSSAALLPREAFLPSRGCRGTTLGVETLPSPDTKAAHDWLVDFSGSRTVKKCSFVHYESPSLCSSVADCHRGNLKSVQLCKVKFVI